MKFVDTEMTCVFSVKFLCIGFSLMVVTPLLWPAPDYNNNSIVNVDCKQTSLQCARACVCVCACAHVCTCTLVCMHVFVYEHVVEVADIVVIFL